MSLKQLLADQGIITTRIRPGTYYIDCPKQYCKQARMADDVTCLELVVVEAGCAHWKCRNCLWTATVGAREERPPEVAPAPAPPTEPEEFLATLGITPALARENGVVWNEKRKALRIPYFHDGEVVNNAFMRLPEETVEMELATGLVFYGAHKLKAGEQRDDLIVTQREIDALTLQALGYPNVIAIPNGGAGIPSGERYDPDADALAFFADRPDIFASSTRIILALDNTPEGDKLRFEIVRRVGAAKCWNVKFYKNTMSATYRESGADFLCQDINEALPQPIRGIYDVDDFMNEVLAYYDGGMSAGVSTGWANVDKLYTVLPGQLTVVTGIPNSGKSTWLDALTVNLAVGSNWRFAVFSPENPKALHVIKLAQKRVKMPVNPQHPERMSRETLISGAAWVNQHYKFIVSESTEEPPTLEWILERAADAVLRYGIKGLVIDPWNRIVKRLDKSETENTYVERALAQILRFAISHNVKVWLVAHPTKQEADKKTGEFAVPSLYSISGGANFPNMMDNGIVIYRRSGADSKYVTEVWARKIRFDHVGTTGHTKLKYDADTGCFELLDEAIYSQAGTGDDGITTYDPE